MCVFVEGVASHEAEERKRQVQKLQPLLFRLITSFLVSSLPSSHHVIRRDIRAGESGELWGVSGSNWYQDLIILTVKFIIIFLNGILLSLLSFVKDFLKAKTDHKVVTEVIQDGDNFTWTQSLPGWTWTSQFTVGQESELVSMKGQKFKVS